MLWKINIDIGLLNIKMGKINGKLGRINGKVGIWKFTSVKMHNEFAMCTTEMR